MSNRDAMKEEYLIKVGNGLDSLWRRARVTDDFAHQAKESGFLTADVADEIHAFAEWLESRARPLCERVQDQLPPPGWHLRK